MNIDIVRCKECKWRPKNMGSGVCVEDLIFPETEDWECPCPFAADDPWYNKEPRPDDFCSRGEREVLDGAQ